LPWSYLFMVGKPRNCIGRDLNWILCMAWKKWIDGSPLEHLPYSPDLTPCDFWAFPTMKGALRQEISRWSTICSTFLRSRWTIVRSASLAKGGALKKSPSLHLHKIPTCSNKVSPWIFKWPS
jgi:hypothetical protein